MANFKRRRSKRQVRCTMCTKTSWLGNNKGRWTDKREQSAKIARREMRERV